MKFVISLAMALVFVDFSKATVARAPFVISYARERERAIFIEKMLVDRLHLPQVLVELHYQKPACQSIARAIIHLCWDEKSQLRLVKRDEKQLQAHFAVFLPLVLDAEKPTLAQQEAQGKTQ